MGKMTRLDAASWMTLWYESNRATNRPKSSYKKCPRGALIKAPYADMRIIRGRIQLRPFSKVIVWAWKMRRWRKENWRWGVWEQKTCGKTILRSIHASCFFRRERNKLCGRKISRKPPLPSQTPMKKKMASPKILPKIRELQQWQLWSRWDFLAGFECS